MANKIPHPANHTTTRESSTSQADAVSELDVLNPERDVTLGGKAYTVREYGHLEWFRLLAAAEPLVAMVTQKVTEKKQQGKPQEFSLEDVLLLVSENFETMMPMVLQCADMPASELETLKVEEINLLVAAWWGVNSHFFSTGQCQEYLSNCRRKKEGSRRKSIRGWICKNLRDPDCHWPQRASD